MSCEEDSYPQFSKDLVGGYVYTRDKAPLVAAAVEITILLSSVVSPPATGVTWVVPDIATQVNTYTVRAQVLKGPGTLFVLVPGKYRVWYRVQSNPENSFVSNPSTFRVV